MMLTYLIGLVATLALTLLTGPYVIRKLRELKFGQNVRSDGPESHLVKQGIPSMGGIMFLTASSVVSLIASGFDADVMLMVLTMLLFGGIGFADDYLKIRKKSSDGLSARQKMVLLIGSGIIVAVIYNVLSGGRTDLRIPFAGTGIDIGVLFIPFVVLLFASVTNAVNLTDGIDGLSSSVTIVVVLFYMAIGYRTGMDDAMLFGACLVGGLLGFLSFNRYPARVFMGDTGSLALGGAVGILAIFTGYELILILVGIIYVVETLSVAIQVIYFKKTGKRFFRMAPLHHHFEKLGWRENKVVAVFTSITAAAAILSYLLA
jgi:phospho-N-acetylmuramoyl-pentapeptide-transferase